MLVREMRERNSRERCGRGGGNGSSSSSSPPRHHPHHNNDETPNHPPSYTAAPSAPPQQQHDDDDDNNNDLDIDDIDNGEDENTPSSRQLPLQTIFSQKIRQLISWYHSQSGDFQTLLLVSLLFLVLYVALGGRFGLDSALLGERNRRLNFGGVGRTTRGNYGHGNAYDRFSMQNRFSSEANNEEYNNYEQQQQQQQQQHQTRASTGYNDRTNPLNDGYYSSRYEHDEPSRGRRHRGFASSYHMVSGNNSENFPPFSIICP